MRYPPPEVEGATLLVLTPSERKAALLVAGLLALGAVSDWWATKRASRPEEGAASLSAAPDLERETSDSTRARADSVSGPTPAGSVDLNRATLKELDSLPGVGPVLARRILDHRSRHGPFRDPEDLKAVRGIGPRLFERIRPRLRVGRSAPAP